MPTFKKRFTEYNPHLSREENLTRLFQAHNQLVSQISNTLNYLDEENFSASLLQILNNREENDEQTNSQ